MKSRSYSTISVISVLALISFIWVFFTDYLLQQISGNPIEVSPYFQVTKAMALAGAAIAVYFLLRRQSRNSEAQKYDSLVFNRNELETIITESNMGIARLDEKGEFVYANPYFCNLTGYTVAELKQKYYTFIIRAGDNVELDYWDTLLKEGKLKHMKDISVISNKSGKKLICNISVNQTRDNSGAINYIMMLEDITQRNTENKQLKENLRRYSILSMATMEGLWDWNLITGQLYYNSNVKLLFGYDDVELQRGYSWWIEHIHPEDREKIIDKMDGALNIPHVNTINNEYRFLCKDGTYKVITDCFSIMRDSEGKAFRLIASLHDVTDQRYLQQQLAEKETIYRRQLARTVLDTQESERRKLAEELHDNVNQLLGVVKLYIEHSIVNEQIREGLLRKSNEYIDKAIQELRNLSRNLAPPLLAELGLEHSLMSMAEAIEEVQPITIRVDIENLQEDRLMDGHKLMLYRIVQEQLNNIVKHARAQNATVHLEQSGNRVLLTITDDGAGTDLAMDSGQGMGLRNIRNRVELYQGKIYMDTAPGKGFVLNVEFEV
ncbi:MAG TPA: PAS domain S-box protein [Agriterribacter sp.]|nr:PAS domain S-box protein [Chitinophagaceae bacterium]HRP33393.1 PAS domain S-box protein [Agriterribacter sp.]